MLQKVVSGGQTGADQAALRAARAAGIPTGGWAPKGWLVESPDGRRNVAAPWLAEFGLIECPEPGYRARTLANARDSDGTLWFGAIGSPGFAATRQACLGASFKPFEMVFPGVSTPRMVAGWIETKGIQVLNVAGNRESVAPGIGDRGAGGGVPAAAVRGAPRPCPRGVRRGRPARGF